MKHPPLRVVTLPVSGLELEIRRVDVKTIGMDAAMTYAARAGLLGEAQARAGDGVAAAVSASSAPPRPDTPPRHPEPPHRAQIQRELVRISEREIIRAALDGTRNRYDELLAAFHATEAMPDLGMGQDYGTLVDMIVEHSGFRLGVSALPPEEAEAFPGTLGPHA